MRRLVFPLVLLGCLAAFAAADDSLDIEQVIDGVYARDSLMHADIHDLTMTAVSYSRKLDGDGESKEEKKFVKTYSFKGDRFRVVFSEYWLDGEKQDAKKLAEQVKEAEDRRRKGRTHDASIDPMRLFSPENRGHYRFSMPGIEKKRGYDCYHIVADCMVEDEDLLEGDFWVETDGLNPVYVEFHPAKMPSKIKQLDMQRSFVRHESGYFLPEGFYLLGRGKVMIFIKFNFEVEEQYSEYVINGGLSDAIFQEAEDED